VNGWQFAAENAGLVIVLACIAAFALITLAGFATDGVRGRAKARQTEAQARLVEAENRRAELAAELQPPRPGLRK
jgi:hypothetical protein